MAHHKSAQKRIRSNIKKTKVRSSRITRIRGSIKKVETAIEAKDHDNALKAFNSAESEIMRGASKGVLHKSTASRRVSNLSRRIKVLKQQ